MYSQRHKSHQKQTKFDSECSEVVPARPSGTVTRQKHWEVKKAEKWEVECLCTRQ
jgi:hypothetical protein